MAYNETSIGKMIKQGRSVEASNAIMKALVKTNGNTVHAALDVGVHVSTFKRWMRTLQEGGWELRAQLAKIRGQNGAAQPTLTAAQLAERQNNVRQGRENARLLAWVHGATNVQLDAIAHELGVRAITVYRLRLGKRVGDGRVWGAVKKHAEAQRALWRKPRSRGQKTIA